MSPCFRAILTAALAVTVFAQDQVVLSNISGDANHLFVWGLFSDLSKHKKFLNETASTVAIGDVKLAIVNEVVSLTQGRRPAYKKHLWSLGADTVAMNFPDVLNLKTRVWVLCPDDPCGSLLPGFSDGLLEKLTAANTLFAEQNAGIRLDLAAAGLISDQTGNAAKKAAYADFVSGCGGISSGMKDKDALNLYIVRSVDGQPNRGKTCASYPNVAVVGYLGGGGLIAHEIGHNLGLWHSAFHTELDGMGLRNLMHSDSSTRCCLSEGEVFRIHFLKKSFLNNNGSVNNSNPPAKRNEARSCHPTDLTKPCLKIDERIWTEP